MASKKVASIIAFIATVLFVLGLIFLSLGIPLTVIIYLIPTGKTEMFYTNWVLIIGMCMMITSLYLLFWGYSFKKLLEFFKRWMGVNKENE